MDIKITELKSVADQLFTHLQQSGHEIVSIPYDYYWFIPKEMRYDVYSQPCNLTMGQLSDDLTELKRIVEGEVEPISFALIWLASLVMAIGEEIVA